MSKENRDSVLKKYLKLVKQLKGRSPTIAELEDFGLTRNTVRHHYGTRVNLDTTARESSPDSFGDVDIVEAAVENLPKKNLIVTAAVVGCKAHVNFCKSLAKLAEEKDAQVVVIPIADSASRVSPGGKGFLDRTLVDMGFLVINNNVQVTKRLKILCMQLSAKQINPLTGLQRLASTGESIIVGSPKMMLKMVPTNEDYPQAAMSTGACTLPSYETDHYRSRRTAYLADNDHTIGAIIVEHEDGNTFHFRQLQASKSGSVVDLGVEYTPTGTKLNPPEALVMGDWHAGETCEHSINFAYRNYYGAKTIIMHDVHDGGYANRHTEDQPWLEEKSNLLTLEAEIECLVRNLDCLLPRYKEIVIVRSNHDERLDRFLSRGQFYRDPINRDAAARLLPDYLAGRNTLEAALDKLMGFSKRKVKFLERGDSYKVGGIELGAHGDKGSNGARGTLAQAEAGLGPCVIGHSHSPGILRGAWQVGTSTKLDLGYNKSGPSSWLNTHCLVYKDGRRQLINLIEGEWTNGE